MKLHVKMKKAIIFIILFQITLSNIPFTNKIHNIQLNPISSIDFGEHTEDQFYPIYIDPSNITLGDVLLETTGSLVSGTANFSYPESNHTWKIIFPEDFGDVQDLYIRRSYLEFYYPLENADDRITFWVMDESITMNDTIHFQVIAPTPDFSNNFYESNLSYKSYYLSISRLDESNRPYNNVIFRHEMTLVFLPFTYYAWNLTGGIHENITDYIEFSYTIISTGTGQHLIFEMNIGDIKNKTDYLFELILIKDRTQEGFFTDWFQNIVIFFLGGFFLGIATFPFIFQYIFRRVEWKDRKVKSKDYVRYGIPTGAIIGVIAVLLNYLIFFT